MSFFLLGPITPLTLTYLPSRLSVRLHRGGELRFLPCFRTDLACTHCRFRPLQVPQDPPVGVVLPSAGDAQVPSRDILRDHRSSGGVRAIVDRDRCNEDGVAAHEDVL